MNAHDKKLIAQLAQNSGEFIGRLKIVDEKGQERSFNTPFAEQVMALQDFESEAETVIHYKPRQIGDTTVATAYNFNYLYWATDPARCLLLLTPTTLQTLSLVGFDTTIDPYRRCLKNRLRDQTSES